MSAAAPALDQELSEKCAVFGIYNKNGDAANLAYYGLWALQHRGQESSGIATIDGETIHRFTDYGLVAHVYKQSDIEALKGDVAIGHNRYSTSGGNDTTFNQPFVKQESGFALAHNGNFPDCTKLIEFLRSRSIDIDNFNDSSMMAAAINCFIKDGLKIEDAIKKAYPLFTGVFSCVALAPGKLIAFRDSKGVRPLSIGKLDKSYAVASETCAFDTIGATFERDVLPGEMVIIDNKGLTSHQIVDGQQKLDVFEFVYFARPDSVLMGQRVSTVRERMGHEMFKEFSVDADIVVPVPDSSVPAALGYSHSSGIPFNMGLIKNRYINRTFIQPTQELRRRDVKMKLNPITEVLAGKKIALIDDSIVRGTTIKKVVELVKEAGALEVHVLVSSPPVRYPDFYGINLPNQEELIAARMSVEQIRDYIGADSLHFLSYEGMLKATGIDVDKFSASCFDGIYPVDIGSRASSIKQIDSWRSDFHAAISGHSNSYKITTAAKIPA